MKIMTITLHSSENYGSTLQAFALQYFLTEQGYETEIIDYRPYYVATEGRRFRSLLRRIIYMKTSVRKQKVFRYFINNYLKLTPQKYRNYKSLEKKPPKADIYITGSDQLWNSNYPCGRDQAFYLRFVKNGIKMAYAVSLGKYPVPDNELDWIITNIKDFSYISVREQSSQQLIKRRGTEAYLACDPVLLLEPQIYKNMMVKSNFKKYAIVYLVQKSDILDRLLLVIKEELGLAIVTISGFLKKCTFDEHLNDFGPCEFLGLLEGADFIIASSFHATIFSHLFHKDFAIIPPAMNHARIKQFLEITGLQDRIVTDTKDINRVLSPVDYTDISPKLEKFISESKEHFLSSLQNEINKKESE